MSQQANTFIYTEKNMGSTHGELLQYLSGVGGVIRVVQSRYVPQVISVDYSPQRISATGIQQAITQQGVHAGIISM